MKRRTKFVKTKAVPPGIDWSNSAKSSPSSLKKRKGKVKKTAENNIDNAER